MTHNVNWYMIVFDCLKSLEHLHTTWIDEKFIKLLRKKEKNFNQSIRLCKDPNSTELSELEELLVLFLYSIVANHSKQALNLPTGNNHLSTLENDTQFDRILLSKIQKNFLHIVENIATRDFILHSIRQYYSSDDILKSNFLDISKLVPNFGLSLLSICLYLSISPILYSSDSNLHPINDSAGEFFSPLYFFKKILMHKTLQAGSIISVIVGCLQQRLGLCFHQVSLESFYPS